MIGVSPEACPALILNADFRPLSYFPLSVCRWQDAIKAVYLDRVTIISEYEHSVSSPSMKIRLPSVICLKDYVATNRQPAFTRFNVFLRDEFSCQYCGDAFETHDLTFDHVIPRAKGGKTSWQNVVASCSPCNLKKGSKLPSECQMHPLRRPDQPTPWDLWERGKNFPPNYLHESWRDFLYWDEELID